MESVDPSRTPEEVFDLYSIPAYDTGDPEIQRGADIRSSKKAVRPGDVLLSRIVPHIRRVWIVGPTRGRQQIASTEWIVFRGAFHGLYLKHYLLSPGFHSQFMQTVAGVGGSLLRARPSEVEKIRIDLPSADEQRRIATILDKAEAVRLKRQQSITLTDGFLRSVFLDMFGDPHSNAKKWARRSLGDMVVIDSPMVDPTAKEYSKLLHIGPDRIEKETGRLLPAITAEQEGLISGKYLFDERHVLYTKIRPYLRKVALPQFKGLCSADMYPIEPKSIFMTREFLGAILVSPAFVAYFNSLPDRASIPKINREELSAYQCITPPLELQQRYSVIFKATRSLRARLDDSLDQTVACQASLAQLTFSSGKQL